MESRWIEAKVSYLLGEQIHVLLTPALQGRLREIGEERDVLRRERDILSRDNEALHQEVQRLARENLSISSQLETEKTASEKLRTVSSFFMLPWNDFRL